MIKEGLFGVFNSSKKTTKKQQKNKKVNLTVQGPSWQSVFLKLTDKSKNASQTLFEGGFEILKLDSFRHCNVFSWNAYWAPSIGPDGNHLRF